MTSSQQTRIEELHATIAARLRKVCRDWPSDRFEDMVRRLAAITFKYERQLLRPNDRPSTEELIEQVKALGQRGADKRRSVSLPDMAASS